MTVKSKILAVLFHQNLDDIQGVAEIFCRYSSQISVRDHEAILMEVSKSMGLYSMESLIHRVQAHLTGLGLCAKIAVAEDAPTALALARFSKVKKGELPVSALLDYVSPFKSLSPKEDSFYHKKIQLLQRLGVKTLGRFLALPEKSIVNHLGGEMLSVYDAIKDSRDLPWPFFKPKEKVIESLSLEQKNATSNNLEGMSFLFKSLVDRTILRLRGRGERLLKFRIVLDLEKHSQSEGERTYHFDLSLPHASARDLLFMIREKLEFDFQQNPLTALVEDLHLEVLETSPHQLAQKDLLNPKKEEENEAFRSLISRLAEKVGSQKIFMAEPETSYRPETSWKKTLKDLNTCEAMPMEKNEFPPRPIRLFKSPIRVNPTWLSQVKILNAPEVLAGEWWDKGFERIYFRVEADHGEQFWVFKTKSEVFIHGAF